MLHGVSILQLWAHTGPGQVAYVPGQLGNCRQGCLKGSKHGLGIGLGRPFKELPTWPAQDLWTVCPCPQPRREASHSCLTGGGALAGITWISSMALLSQPHSFSSLQGPINRQASGHTVVRMGMISWEYRLAFSYFPKLRILWAGLISLHYWAVLPHTPSL